MEPVTGGQMRLTVEITRHVRHRPQISTDLQAATVCRSD